MNNMNNKENEEYSLKREEFLSYINSFNNKINTISTKEEIKSIKKELILVINNLKDLLEKTVKEKETHEILLKKEENMIRKLYSDLLHEKILKEILEEKIFNFLKMQSEYELIKEKTGVIVCDGKIISDGRKDNEITILRTENSTLKNVINEKEKEIEKLNNEIKKNQIKKNTNTLFVNNSQRDFIFNSFSSTTRNFYKSYKMQTKLLNNQKNINKTIERNSTNNYINSKDNISIIQEKKISVNTNKFKNDKKIISRNKVSNHNNNYASCENILNKTKIKQKKIIKKNKIFYPMREYNSVRYINTQSNANNENKENINNNINNNEIIFNNNKKQKKNNRISILNKKDNKYRTYYDGFKIGIKK